MNGQKMGICGVVGPLKANEWTISANMPGDPVRRFLPVILAGIEDFFPCNANVVKSTIFI